MKNGGEYVLALGGDDSVGSGDGDDVIKGGGGDDSLGGGNGEDLLDGGRGTDSLYGGRGADVLIGGLGDDEIVGDVGRDVMTGGLGVDRISVNNSGDSDGRRDTVIYESVADSTPGSEDILYDFRVGEDKIDLSRIDADASTPGDDAFHYIKGQAFTGVAGELRFDGEFVEADVDGDGQADLRLDLQSIAGPSDDHVLHARDFVL